MVLPDNMKYSRYQDCSKLVDGFSRYFGGSNRLRWIQIQGFFQTFFWNNNFFLQTRDYQVGDQYMQTLKNVGTKVFSLCSPSVRARLNHIDQNNTKTSLKSTSCSFEKNSRLFTIFPDFVSTFQTSSRSGKLLGKFQAFLKNWRICTNPLTLWLRRASSGGFMLDGSVFESSCRLLLP